MRINVHAGHNKIVPGASKFLNEVTENRKVKNEVIYLLKNNGQTVYDCTDAISPTKNGNLQRIVKKCNAHTVDLDVSIHLNSGRKDSAGDGKTGGIEVWCYDSRTKAIAERICKKVSNVLGVTNRGVKYSKDFYVLRNTKAPAILIECCFVDDKDDYKKWNDEACAKAIAEGILNKSISNDQQVIKNSYLVKVTAGSLNIRANPDPNSKVTGCITDKGTYTITETKKSRDGGTWGKLKSGVGWINLYYTKKV